MKLTGIVRVKLDSDLVRSKSGASLEIGGFNRKAQKGHKVYGHTDEVMESVCTFVIFHAGGDDLRGIANKIDSTLEFETDTGDTYMIPNAFCTKPPKLTGGDGEVELEFAGDPAELV